MMRLILTLLAVSLLLAGCLQPGPQPTPTPGATPTPSPTGYYSAEDAAAAVIEAALNTTMESVSEIEEELVSGG